MAAVQVERTAGTQCFEAAVEKMRDGVQAMADWIGAAGGEALGEGLIQIRESGIDPLEAVFASGVRRSDQSGEYKADGALSLIAWLKWKCKLSGGAAAERVEIARQLEKLPKTEAAFASGDLGYQHVALIARTAEHVGAAAVRKEEGRLLQAAQTHDPGQFLGVTKNFEHRVDAEGALTEANQAHARRYLHLGEPQNGMVRIDGLLDAEGGATLRGALEPFMKPMKDDDRTFGQRQHDALIELCWQGAVGKREGAGGKRDATGPRPHLIIRASLDTLAGIPGAPAGEIDGGGTVPAATVQRYACDTAIARVTGHGELEHELTHATRTIPPSTRRALEARDQHCVFEGCDRRLNWCDGHHLVWWIKGGPTTLSNLALLCRRHHRMVHEEGWTLERRDGRLKAIPPARSVRPRSRSD
jgi:Domain of unknown function (DUF222)/HNH endonuclease